MRTPTDAEKCEAVERWARATGRWRETGEPFPGGWSLSASTQGRMALGSADDRWHVGPDTALLACLLIAAGLTVDVGRCPTCKGVQDRDESPAFTSRLDAAVWLTARKRQGDDVTSTIDGGTIRVTIDRPCRACAATGRDTREAVRLLLDAAPRRCPTQCLAFVPNEAAQMLPPGAFGYSERQSPWRRERAGDSPELPRIYASAYPAGTYRVCSVCNGEGFTSDPKAREALTVLADDRQQAGDQLGEWLALWLGGHDGWQGAAMRLLRVIAMGVEMATYAESVAQGQPEFDALTWPAAAPTRGDR